MDIVDLRGREHEPVVIRLLAAAQIHRKPDDALGRAASIASEYARAESLRLWGAEQDGNVIGIAGVEIFREDDAILRDMAIDTSSRGRGIGRSLLDFLQREAGFAHIEGDTLEPAAGFYERCGFTIHEDGQMPDGRTRYRFSWRAPAPS